jgi:Sulfotransferase domain
MWSGPRNISTAMMRAFGSRSDCHPVDEPFYAYYLKQTGLQHPMRADILDSQQQDWQAVVAQINTTPSADKSFKYLKHMTQHMLPQIDRHVFNDHINAFLIRDPRLVIASFSEKWDQVSAEATGFRQQMDLYEHFCTHGNLKPIIIEGEDIQKAPETMLRKFCEESRISFDPAMLSWTAGTKAEDGVWGSHWYNAVIASTGFAPYREKTIELTKEQEALAHQLTPIYQELKSQKLNLQA